MKQLLITTIAAVLLVGCGPSGDPPPLAHSIEDGRQDLARQTDIKPVLMLEAFLEVHLCIMRLVGVTRKSPNC